MFLKDKKITVRADLNEKMDRPAMSVGVALTDDT